MWAYVPPKNSSAPSYKELHIQSKSYFPKSAFCHHTFSVIWNGNLRVKLNFPNKLHCTQHCYFSSNQICVLFWNTLHWVFIFFTPFSSRILTVLYSKLFTCGLLSSQPNLGFHHPPRQQSCCWYSPWKTGEDSGDHVAPSGTVAHPARRGDQQIWTFKDVEVRNSKWKQWALWKITISSI